MNIGAERCCTAILDVTEARRRTLVDLGGSVAVFSVVGVPRPFEEAERLVWIENDSTR